MIERSSGLLVCPISGTVRDDLRSGLLGPAGEGEGEEEEAGADEGAADFGGEWRWALLYALHLVAAQWQLFASHCSRPLANHAALPRRSFIPRPPRARF